MDLLEHMCNCAKYAAIMFHFEKNYLYQCTSFSSPSLTNSHLLVNIPRREILKLLTLDDADGFHLNNNNLKCRRKPTWCFTDDILQSLKIIFLYVFFFSFKWNFFSFKAVLKCPVTKAKLSNALLKLTFLTKVHEI